MNRIESFLTQASFATYAFGGRIKPPRREQVWSHASSTVSVSGQCLRLEIALRTSLLVFATPAHFLLRWATGRKRSVVFWEPYALFDQLPLLVFQELAGSNRPGGG